MSGVTVRPARADDISWCVETGKRFHAATVYGSVAQFDDGDVRLRVARMIAGWQDSVVYIAEEGGERVGTIGAVLNSPWFNLRSRFAQELFWWVVPEARKSKAGPMLLDALERWWPTRAQGLLMLRTPNIEPKVMDRLYRIKGFRPWDGYYMKTR